MTTNISNNTFNITPQFTEVVNEMLEAINVQAESNLALSAALRYIASTLKMGNISAISIHVDKKENESEETTEV